MTYLLWHYLAESAQRFPSRPAVIWQNSAMSYRDLDGLSTRLAKILVRHGIAREKRVGLYMPKSSHSIVAMLGISKAGSAYVPLDPQAPPRRIAFIMENCSLSGLITTTRQLAQVKDHLRDLRALRFIMLADVDADDSSSRGVQPEIHSWGELERADWSDPDLIPGVETDPAYLLYTSGSTGTPKGVILSHRHALTFVDWAAETFAVTPEDRLSNHAPLHFDLSVFDLYAAFRSGACVVLVPDEISPFPIELARWIEDQEISIWYSVPSALIRLLLHGKMERYNYRNLRAVLFAGEVFPVKYLREIMQKWRHSEFYNLYGPTETNVCTYFKAPRPLQPGIADVSIGKACANTEVFAVDDQESRITPGQTGELYVKGPSVMLGYWGLPEKTGQVLVANPLQPAYHEQIYRTGDIVRLEADGNYSFIGRKDHMVKSRGYRIELGEIEQVLYQHDLVREAVVVALPDDEIGSRLKAFIAPNRKGALSDLELQSFCSARLPKYMVPEAFILTHELPKTSTGKIDRVVLAKRLESGNQEMETSKT